MELNISEKRVGPDGLTDDQRKAVEEGKRWAAEVASEGYVENAREIMKTTLQVRKSLRKGNQNS